MPRTFPVAHAADGIPRISAYEQLVASEFFRDLEEFSSGFLRRHGSALEPYARKWVADPLHQWSRQWEYPWVYAGLEEFVQASPAGGQPPRILDAGSGVTFFPYLLTERLSGARVTCLDQDEMLAPIYADITKERRASVEFRTGALAQLEQPDSSLDAIYCVSVLEHTRDHDRILDQFARTLRPGGRLLLTFDVSLDGRTDVAPAAARSLIEAVERRFEPVLAPSAVDLEQGLADPGLFTTEAIRRSRPELLPWRSNWRTDVVRLLTARRPGPPFFLCTVVCGHWRRGGQPAGL